MIRMCTFLVLNALVFSTNHAWAGGPGKVYGQTKQYSITIEGDHPFQDATIIVREIDDGGILYEKVVVTVPFSTQCRASETMLKCKKDGKTPLSGTAYRLTLDATPICPGTDIGGRYTCTQGCGKHTPRYLEFEPYEC